MKNKFQGFNFPEKNYYQFPKDLNGHYSQLSGNEFKVLAYIVRKTWGFNKVEDKISYSQFLNGIVNKDGVKIFDGLGMSEDTLIRCLKSLKNKEFIEIDSAGKGGGRGRVSAYRLKYKHPENQGDKKDPDFAVKKTPILRKKDPENQGHNKEINNKENNNKSLATFSLLKETQKLLYDPRRHIQIIGLWIKEKGLTPENAEQLQSIIKRNVRPARLLNGYGDDDIRETIEAIKKTDYISKFTLETCLKFIDEVVAHVKRKGPKIVRWQEITKPDGTKAMRAIYEKN